jgi:hypothetical protein
MKIGDIIGIIFLVCATHFAMTVLIRAELKINPNPTDGLLLRWKATRAPMICLIGFVIFIYAVYFAGYHLTVDSFDGTGETLLIIGGKILIVVCITVPVILFNLFGYHKNREIS